MKLLMSSYGERALILVPIDELDAVRSHNPFVGEVLKIDLGFDGFFALATPKTPSRLGRYRVFILLRRQIPQNKRFLPHFPGQVRQVDGRHRSSNGSTALPLHESFRLGCLCRRELFKKTNNRA
jgi:hypothetical protein